MNISPDQIFNILQISRYELDCVLGPKVIRLYDICQAHFPVMLHFSGPA